jgi:hypothetical protein
MCTQCQCQSLASPTKCLNATRDSRCDKHAAACCVRHTYWHMLGCLRRPQCKALTYTTHFYCCYLCLQLSKHTTFNRRMQFATMRSKMTAAATFEYGRLLVTLQQSCCRCAAGLSFHLAPDTELGRWHWPYSNGCNCVQFPSSVQLGRLSH